MKRAIIFLYSLIVTSQVFSQITEEEKRFVKENNLSQQEYSAYLNRKSKQGEARPAVKSALTANCIANIQSNIGFELGNFSGWDIFSGSNVNLNPDSMMSVSSSTIVSLITSGTDQYTGLLLNSPLGGTKIAKINDNINNCSAQVLKTTFNVTNATKFLKTAFAVVFQTAEHVCSKNPYFKIEVYNCNETQKLNEYVTLIQEGYCVGDNLLSATTNSNVGDLSYSSWRTHCFDFSSYLNSNITVKVSVGDCPFIGHFGYAYFDAAFAPSVNNGLNYNYSINSTNLNFAATNTTSSCFQNSMSLNLPAGSTGYSSAVTGSYALPGPFSATTQVFAIPPSGSGPLYIMMNNAANNCYQQQLINVGITPTINITPSSSSVCPGANYTLTVNGANKYYFLPNNPQFTTSTNTFVINATGPVTHSIVGINTGSCTNTATLTVNLYPPAQLTVSPVSQTICSGNSATLIANGALTYTWTGSMNGTSILVTPTITSNYGVIGNDMNGCIATGASGTVTVLPTTTNFSVFASGSSSICPGDSINISCSNTAQSVLWSNGSTLIAQYVKPVTTTVYTVTGTMNCNTVVKTLTITVKPVLPTNITVSSPSLVCENTSFTVNTTGAASYTYIGTNSVTTSGLASINLPYGASNFTVIAKNPANCSTTFSIIPVTVNNNPTLSITQSAFTICAGQQVTVSATGANTYTWTNYFFTTQGTGSTISFTTNPFFNPVYQLYATGANGCLGYKSYTVTTEPFPINISSNTNTLCLGPSYSVALSASYVNTATTTYTWNGSILSHSIIDTPTITTTYTLEAYNPACGYMSATKTITVFPSYGPTVSATVSSSLVCAGQQTVGFTASGANSYQFPFFSVTTNTSIIITPVNPVPGNTYVVTGYDTYGCSALSNPLSLTITPLPVLNNMPQQTICPGTPITLTVSGAQTYSWSTGATSSVIVVSPTVATVYSVTGFNNPGSCSVTAQKNVNVHAVPTLTIIPALSSSVCPGGQPKTIYLNSSSAVTNTWSTGSTATSITVTPTVATVYTVTITDFYNCKTAQPFTVGIYNLPTVSVNFSPPSSCMTNTVAINAVGFPSGGYFTPANYSTNILFPVGTYSVKYTYTDPISSCSNSAVGSHSVFPNPCVSALPVNDTLCLGQNTAFNLSPNGGILSGQFLNGNTFNPAIAGAYPFSYSYSDANGCSAQACTSVFVDICTSVSKTHLEEDFELSVAPNPFNGSFTILTSKIGSFRYHIYDVNGKLIISSEAENNTDVDLSDFADGIYFLRFNQKASSKGIKVVKTR